MMKNNATKHPRRWRHRAIGVLGALMIAGSALALTAAAVAAMELSDPHCDYPYGSNMCLSFGDEGGGIYNARVGIDIYMSQAEAQRIFDATGGAPFGVEIIAHDQDDPADDTSGLEEIGDEPDDLYQVSVGPNGLYGQFEEKIACRILNEDNDGRDEVVAQVTLYDPAYPEPAQFHSGIVVGNFENCGR